MAYDLGLMPVWFYFSDDYDDPLGLYHFQYSIIAVVNMVLSKYLYNDTNVGCEYGPSLTKLAKIFVILVLEVFSLSTF